MLYSFLKEFVYSLNNSVVPFTLLTVASQIRWSGIPLPHLFKSFPLFVMIHTVKGVSVVNGTEVDVFLEFPCFLYDPADVGNLVSSCSEVSKPSLNIWKFLVHEMLKPSSEDFVHDLTSMR